MLNATQLLNDFINFLGNVENAYTGLLQVTTVQRTGVLQDALIAANASTNVYDTDLSLPYWWTGTAWQTWPSGGGGSSGTWLTGSVVPTGGVGVDGQFYLLVDNSISGVNNGSIYLKTSGTWNKLLQMQVAG